MDPMHPEALDLSLTTGHLPATTYHLVLRRVMFFRHALRCASFEMQHPSPMIGAGLTENAKTAVKGSHPRAKGHLRCRDTAGMCVTWHHATETSEGRGAYPETVQSQQLLATRMDPHSARDHIEVALVGEEAEAEVTWAFEAGVAIV